MATVVAAQPPVVTLSDWQQETVAALCTASLVHVNVNEQEKENASAPSPVGERSKPKVEPILEWQRKEFERLVEEFDCSIYPTRDEKEKLAAMLKASYPQITRLFANHRRRILKKKAMMAQSNVKENSVERLLTMIKEPSPVGDSLVHDDTSTSERSISPAIRPADDGASETDDSLAAICSAVADLIHDDIESKQKAIPEKKKRTKATKRKVSERDAKLEATVDEILSKVSREEINAGLVLKSELIAATESTEGQMSSTMVGLASASGLGDHANPILLSLVNEVMAQPPVPLPDSMMATVNPKLIEAMALLNKGVSWTHPSILAVLVQIMQQQQQDRQQSQIPFSQLADVQQPPACESANSRSSEKSTEEMMRSLTPDEFLAVNILTEMAGFS